MNAWKRFWREYHALVYCLLLGAIILAIGDSISILYLPLYLMRDYKLDSVVIGLIVGASPLASTIGGFVAGTLSDFIGRRKVMLGSLYLSSLIFFGFALTKDPLILILLIIVKGFVLSFFGPVAKALMGDLTAPDKRLRVFSLRYMSVNIGYAIGPSIGAYFWLHNIVNPFMVTACIYFGYALFLHYLMNYFRIQTIEGQEKEQTSLKGALQVIRRDVILFYFIIGGVIATVVHGKWSVTLQQYLQGNIADGDVLYAALLTVNSIGVIVLQYPLTRRTERYRPLSVIMIGSTLMALGMLGFAGASNWTAFILCMVLFTVGEILIIPAEYIMIDGITPASLRGMYYGAQNFTAIGSFFGPVIGGYLLSSYGGAAMFVVMALCSLLSIFFFWRGQMIQHRRCTVYTSAHSPE